MIGMVYGDQEFGQSDGCKCLIITLGTDNFCQNASDQSTGLKERSSLLKIKIKLFTEIFLTKKYISKILDMRISPSSEGVRESYLAQKLSTQRELSNATTFDKKY